MTMDSRLPLTADVAPGSIVAPGSTRLVLNHMRSEAGQSPALRGVGSIVAPRVA